MYPKKDTYFTRECKNKGKKRAFHNDRILKAKILSLILDDLNRTLVYFYMSVSKNTRL